MSFETKKSFRLIQDLVNIEMYPRTVNGRVYCCKTLRVDSLFGCGVTTRSYGHCKGFNPRNVKCRNHNCLNKKPNGLQIEAEIELEPQKIKPKHRFFHRF